MWLTGIIGIGAVSALTILQWIFAATACALTLFHFFLDTPGIGAASALARVGGIASPFVALDLPNSIAVAVCVACGMVCSATALTLPLETRGQSLTDSVGGAAEDHARLLEGGDGAGAEGAEATEAQYQLHS